MGSTARRSCRLSSSSSCRWQGRVQVQEVEPSRLDDAPAPFVGRMAPRTLDCANPIEFGSRPVLFSQSSQVGKTAIWLVQFVTKWRADRRLTCVELILLTLGQES